MTTEEILPDEVTTPKCLALPQARPSCQTGTTLGVITCGMMESIRQSLKYDRHNICSFMRRLFARRWRRRLAFLHQLEDYAMHDELDTVIHTSSALNLEAWQARVS